MENLSIAHKEILRLNRIASISDDEIRKYPSSIRAILFVRKRYSYALVTKRVNSEMSHIEFIDKLSKIQYCDNQLKEILGIK